MIRPTTIIFSDALCSCLHTDVVLASETFQRSGSFKFRAAVQVVATTRAHHIIAASSGNFGQALALACKLAGKSCTVVMPQTSAAVKVEAVREYGGKVLLIDTETISRAERVAQLAVEFPDARVTSAYDDLDVIEGNSSLGVEIAALSPACDVVVAPLGGGGLCSGLITGLRRAGSTALVVGAEPLAANDAALSLRAGALVRNLREPDTIADGARTASLGDLNWAILNTGLDAIVEVPETAIADAVRLLYGRANLKAEPTGALAVGALLTDQGRFIGKRVCAVISGGNVDADTYANIIAG